MSQEEEIKKLIEIGTETADLNIVNNIIYNLAAYGPKSIPAINELVDRHPNTEIRDYGMETIKKIKEHSYPRRRF
ncbi:MAG: hypothetical protein JSV56_12575 [Methanomassiliicoccales archaeon]|nr:MAG: hypothetical protein JSV56_12575 [Methanomassiliicoccales archaeon]